MSAEPKPDRTPVLRGYALAIVLTHFALSVAHGLAHGRLAVALTIAQKSFVALVIVAAPLLAGYLIWKYRLFVGSAILTISMAGSLAFGVYHHFMAIGPDNVDYDRPGAPANWRNLFEDTAIDLTLIEGLGLFAGAALMVKSRGQGKSPEHPSDPLGGVSGN